ncbi:M56 family metallopeptidase [Cohnella suwonensis]|uniref:M56 family metallopeptidase n=1 Tax=Cohnella suwonensis TaxID=696072 RepID=A0ABW0LWP7_9BACL
MGHVLGSTSYAVFRWVLDTSLMAGMLVLMIVLIKWMFNTKLSLKLHYALWIVLIARLLLPYAPESSLSVFNLISVDTPHVIEPSQTDFFPSQNPPTEITDPSPSQGNSEIVNIGEKSERLASLPAPDVLSLQNFPNHMTLMDTVVIIWLFGALSIAIILYRMNHKFSSKIRKGKRINDATVLHIYEECKARLGVKAEIPLVETDAVTGPTLFGVFRAKLLMPMNSRELFQPDELNYIFVHELSHFRRKDIALNGLFSCLLVVHWFNPLLWYAFYRMREDQELACDSLALSFVDPEKINDYGHTIIRVLETYSKGYRSTSIAHFSSIKSQLKRRILMIKYFSKNSYRLSFVGLLLILVLCGCVLTNPKTDKTNSSNIVPTTSSLNSKGSEQQHEAGDIHISKNIHDELPGSLTSETTLGQIRIGNTKSEVFRTLGDPDIRSDDEQTGYEKWIYNKHALTVQFFRISKAMPVSSVVDIIIKEGSDLITDTGIGISSTVDQIQKFYPELNTNEATTTIWINGNNASEGKGYYPTLKFEMKGNSVREIELTNRGVDPGPIQQQPLSLADLEIGGIRIGGDIDDVIAKYGQPSEKTIAHGLGSPYWIFKKQGLAIDFGGPIWQIWTGKPFRGSTPRGIRIGSTKEDVIKAYPDMIMGSSGIQKSTDEQYSIQIGFTDDKVSNILISQEIVLQ